MDPTSLAALLGQPSTSTAISCLVLEPSARPSPSPQVKEYSDATYHNYFAQGISLCFLPSLSSPASRTLSHIDIFNPPLDDSSSTSTTSRRKRKDPWDGYSSPALPLRFTFPTSTITVPAGPGKDPIQMDRGTSFEVTSKSVGKDFVQHFGEPSKKGGGQTAYIPPFLEWSSIDLVDAHGKTVPLGIMIELRDPKGADALTEEQQKKGAGGIWDRAAAWEWAGLKLFAPGTQV